MPRKTKAFKSKLKEARKAYQQGKVEEANQLWRQVTVDRAKLKAEKAAKAAEKKAAKAKRGAPAAS